MIQKIRKKFTKREEGQALVEMALVIPILLLFFMGIFEFGRIFGSLMVINNLARDGVRHGVVGNNDTQIEELIYENITWLDEENVTITITPTYSQRSKGEALEVNVDYTVPIIMPFISGVLPNPFPLSANYTMRVER
ncbi:hypothetical protein SYNTR_1519 [Candidatus Syntrophocurvum alkaliphilum]|uniref:TadE-like domain-containing protein n=1 Tax=Candidatus Syntrophocurvum alkaliphilum TaxID=2293317 RepID=A0A6I6DH29_9FIRM|nr:TadE/TadG family type IV pilus assembly protein [Candidatus Syntrophocurvum alkaliphilum]QGU00113.1 hypothetical protein SYNTR_1519 [Candidatus Syntrophocurvum alkaliphilum]